MIRLAANAPVNQGRPVLALTAALPATLAAALVLVLSACTTVGPDYAMPAEAVLNRTQAQGKFASADIANHRTGEPAVALAPLPEHWWKLYNDPALDVLIERAFARNTDLRVAQANLEKVQAQLQDARAAAQPSIGVNAQPSFGHASGVSALSPDVRPDDHYSYSVGTNVSYAVDLFGQIRRAEEAAIDDTQAAQAALAAVRVTIAAETARAYADACAAGMQLADARQSVHIQQASLDVTTRLLQAGRGTRLDTTRAQAQLDQLRAALPPFKAQRQVSLFRLATLTGDVPSAFPADLAQCDRPPALAQPIPVGDGAALLARRPDVREAERQLAAQTARIGVATADLYPKISLGLSAQSGGPLNMIGERGTYSWSLGPLISWTLPNTGATHARIAAAEASTRAAAANFDGVVLTALRETETALTQYARQLDRDAALKAARDDSAQAADQARTLLKNGRTDYLTVLDAERTLAQTQSQWAASRAALTDQQIMIFMVLGGGWTQ